MHISQLKQFPFFSVWLSWMDLVDAQGSEGIKSPHVAMPSQDYAALSGCRFQAYAFERDLELMRLVNSDQLVSDKASFRQVSGTVRQFERHHDILLGHASAIGQAMLKAKARKQPFSLHEFCSPEYSMDAYVAY